MDPTRPSSDRPEGGDPTDPTFPTPDPASIEPTSTGSGAPAWGASAGVDRPIEVGVASIILMILGGFGVLLGVVYVVLGAYKNVGYAIFGGVILLLFGLIYLFGGIGSMRGRGWGRVLGVIAGMVGVIAGIVGVLFVLLNGLSTEGGGVAIVLFGLHAFIAWALAARWRNWGTRTA